ncbi:MAG: hypothetical protein J6N52_07225 [Clostridia bacterium]|nr:hypothetical protein [Clostridia bacterium]
MNFEKPLTKKFLLSLKIITKSKMSPASIGGGFHLLFSAGVQSPTETLNDGALSLIERRDSVVAKFATTAANILYLGK